MTASNTQQKQNYTLNYCLSLSDVFLLIKFFFFYHLVYQFSALCIFDYGVVNEDSASCNKENWFSYRRCSRIHLYAFIYGAFIRISINHKSCPWAKYTYFLCAAIHRLLSFFNNRKAFTSTRESYTWGSRFPYYSTENSCTTHMTHVHNLIWPYIGLSYGAYGYFHMGCSANPPLGIPSKRVL